MSDSAERVLTVRRATPERFEAYGFVVGGSSSKPRGPEEAELDLAAGRPRFYVMRLERRGRSFSTIARHCRVTQCLASAGGRPWLLAVAPPSRLEDPTASPEPDHLEAFEIPGDVFVQLHRGTWHAGPYFEDAQCDFFNLELSDTNETDFHSVDLEKLHGLRFRFGESGS